MVKVFVELYRAGLIYKDKRLVNWDPKLHTAISDLEVQQVECRGSFKWDRGGEKPFEAAALAKVLEKNPNGHLLFRLSARGRRRRRHHRRDNAPRDDVR